MKITDYDYENPWRPNYEAYAVSTWFIAGVATLITNMFTGLPSVPIYAAGTICMVFSVFRALPAYKLYKLHKHLDGRPLEYNTFEDLKNICSKNPNLMWLGTGFIWEQKHAQRVHQILSRSLSDTFDISKDSIAKQSGLGARWIHGVEPKEYSLFQHTSHSDGMYLILGTTGAGKTRLFDQLISQAILRNEPVIIIDPKGDLEMRENARRACERLGCPERFAYFHPAFPDESVCIDPSANYQRTTELASRVASLIIEEGPFKEFAWLAANNINHAMQYAGISPSLVNLKRYLQNGSQYLVWNAIKNYFTEVVPETDKHPSGQRMVEQELQKISSNKDIDTKKADALCSLYEQYKQLYGKPELDGIVSMYRHNRDHFSKMVTNIMPILEMLTAGSLAGLLSPNYGDPDDQRLKIDAKIAIERNMVLFIGLDTLSDAKVGASIGSIILADLVAYAGERYRATADKDVAKTLPTVNIFIDESAEVINGPTVQLLNKGRGAKMRSFLASQTISDITVRLGSEDNAMQALGNINNLIALRVKDTKTQEYVSNQFYKTRIKSKNSAQGLSVSEDNPFMFSASTGERLTEEEAELFPPHLLGMLPNLEFISILSGGQVRKGRIPILQ